MIMKNNGFVCDGEYILTTLFKKINYECRVFRNILLH